MAQVRWSNQALIDLEEIFEYLFRDSPSFAADLVQDLTLAPRRLAKHPRIGRMVPEYEVDRLRELLIGSYRLVYEITDERIEMLRILHGRRDFLFAMDNP